MSAETGRPPSCPYCNSVAVLRPAVDIYKYENNYGPLWACASYPKCDAYVGCHPGTEKPLGRLADGCLRFAKQRAHKAFDPLWEAKMRRTGCSKGEARRASYTWLAGQLGIPPQECHIGMMDTVRCIEVEAICEPYTRTKKRAVGTLA